MTPLYPPWLPPPAERMGYTCCREPICGEISPKCPPLPLFPCPLLGIWAATQRIDWDSLVSGVSMNNVQSAVHFPLYSFRCGFNQHDKECGKQPSQNCQRFKLTEKHTSQLSYFKASYTVDNFDCILIAHLIEVYYHSCCPSVRSEEHTSELQSLRRI